MNTCQHVRDQLMKMLDDGETTPPDSLRVHLRTCKVCSVWWEQMGAVDEVFCRAGEAMPAAPDSLLSRVMSALDSEKKPSRSSGGAVLGLRYWTVAAATVLLVAGISALLWTSYYKGTAVHVLADVSPMPSVTSLASLDGLVVVPQPVVSARQDFTWLTRAVVSNTESALRALVPDEPALPHVSPTETPQGQVES